MIIRPVTISDIDRITKLKEIEDKSRYTKRIEENQAGSAAYLLAEQGDEIVGQVFLKFYGTENDPNTPNMEDLLVKEKYRNKGIGTALIDKCEQLCRAKDYKAISLSVNPTLNPKAKSLYEKLGYITISKEPYLDAVYNGVEDWVIDLVKEL